MEKGFNDEELADIMSEIESLEQFLDSLCKQEKLETDGLMYSLPK